MGGRKTVGIILGETIRLYRRSFTTFFITTLIVYGVTYLFNKLDSWVIRLLRLDSNSAEVLLSHESIERSITKMGLDSDIMIIFLLTMAGLCLFFVVSTVVTTLFALPGKMLTVGAYDVMLGIHQVRDQPIHNAAKTFKGNWRRYLGISAWSSLFIWLWSILFAIPGIVKTYAYLFAPFLILDYPGMTMRQALKKSTEITNGYKGRLFGLAIIVGLPLGIISVILGLAFMILGQLPTYSIIINIIGLITGLFIFQPVTYMMYTVAYLDIKQAAIEKGLLPGANSPYSIAEPLPEAAAAQPIRSLDDLD